MNKKHIGDSFFDDVKKWENADPDFRRRVNEHIEKRRLQLTGDRNTWAISASKRMWQKKYRSSK